MTATTPSYDLVQEPLPPYSSSWGGDVVVDEEKKSEEPRARMGMAWRQAKAHTGLAAQRTMSLSRNKAWPALRKIRFTKKQVYAFLILLALGLLPFILVALLSGFSTTGGAPLGALFGSKTITCGDAFGTPQNSTVSGIEALFVLDATFGRFAFSQVKVIDVAWDVCLGRGAQLLAWYISYIVFSDALLRVIERHSASYQTFIHITIEGASFATMWALVKDLFRTKSKRTWSLFFL
jgi:hypothetical protein